MTERERESDRLSLMKLFHDGKVNITIMLKRTETIMRKQQQQRQRRRHVHLREKTPSINGGLVLHLFVAAFLITQSLAFSALHPPSPRTLTAVKTLRKCPKSSSGLVNQCVPLNRRLLYRDRQQRPEENGRVAITLDASNGSGDDSVTAMDSTTTINADAADEFSYKGAIQRTLAWVAAAILFGSSLWFFTGREAGEEFFAGYLVEQSLSVDNLFVFFLLFDYFKIPVSAQNRVLNWGIIGAVVFRAIMIVAGLAAVESVREVTLVFAGILVYSSAKILLANEDEEEEDPGENSIVKFSRNLIDSTDQFDGDRFFTVVDGVKKATPLLICMAAVEISDIVFAVDSIPAVFGITKVR